MYTHFKTWGVGGFRPCPWDESTTYILAPYEIGCGQEFTVKDRKRLNRTVQQTPKREIIKFEFRRRLEPNPHLLVRCHFSEQPSLSAGLKYVFSLMMACKQRTSSIYLTIHFSNASQLEEDPVSNLLVVRGRHVYVRSIDNIFLEKNLSRWPFCLPFSFFSLFFPLYLLL